LKLFSGGPKDRHRRNETPGSSRTRVGGSIG
jgi:hypothetical protein